MNLPNWLSALRILLAPVLLALAWWGQPLAFLLLLGLTWWTDALDGYLARRLNQVTELGARLDSWGDLAMYLTIALGAWWLWPELLRREAPFVITILVSYLLPIVVGFIKFRRLTSYHTLLVKVAAVLLGIGVPVLLLFGVGWPLRLAAPLCVLAALEELAITLLLPGPRSDIRSLAQARRLQRGA